MMPTFIRLLIFVVAMVGSTTFCVAIVNRTHAYGWNRKLVDLLMLGLILASAFAAWPLALFAFGSELNGYLPGLPYWLVQGWGWASLAVAAMAGIHSIWLLLHSERRGGVANEQRTPLDMKVEAPIELLAPGLTRRLGLLPGNQVVSPECVEVDLLVPNLPDAFEGLKIAHLSDLHMSGRLAQGYYDAIVDYANDWQPDIVAITGDIVERSKVFNWVDETLARLEARDARLFVLGNHDHKSGPEELRRRLTECGFLDVGCRAAEVMLEPGPCLVAGNETPWFRPEPEVPPREEDNVTLRLALLHTPDRFLWTQQNGFHVALAGHVHGGQVRFPILGALLSPSIYGTRYVQGVFTSPTTVMHVTPGTGSLSPLRWNCPPELNLLTLRSA